jgi:O-antigen/teichoic acid export membrane protein
VGISIALLPVYIDILGIESYGLVGFYSTLLGSLAILDLGLSSTLNRELARSIALKTPSQDIKNLVYSLEIIYWIAGIAIGIGTIILAPFIANYWVKANQLSPQQITNAIMLMGGILAFQWPQSIYTGGLMGLQKQVAFNIANAILSTLKSVGVILALKLIAPTISIFFLWQILISCLSALIFRYLLWYFVPKTTIKAHFSSIELRKIWRFAAGMMGISLASFCLLQIDKVLLSRLLSLSDYGYYTLAWTVGTSITLIVGILGNTLLPKLTEIVARGNETEIIINYHRFFRLIASVIIPIGMLLCLFSYDILFIWTNNTETTAKISLAVKILTVGSICSALINVPYYLLLAHGNTRFTMCQNIIASIVLTPLLFWWTSLWGLNGATLVWLAVNVGYVIISLPIMHKTLLKGQLYNVYTQDIGIALGCSLVVIMVAKANFNSAWPRLLQVLYMFIALNISYLSIVFFSKEYKYVIKIAFNRLKYGK